LPGPWESLRTFNIELTKALARLGTTDLAKPAEVYRNIAPDGAEIVMVDGPSFKIQVKGYAADVVLSPGAGSETPLHNASMAVYSKAGACAQRGDMSVSVHEL